MASVKWASPAFEQLEALSERKAIEIIDPVDLLSSFPEWAFRSPVVIHNSQNAAN